MRSCCIVLDVAGGYDVRKSKYVSKEHGSPSTILVATAIDPIVENAQKLALLAEEVPKSGKYAVTKRMTRVRAV